MEDHELKKWLRGQHFRHWWSLQWTSGTAMKTLFCSSIENDANCIKSSDDQMMRNKVQKSIQIIAGPNGAGKTTFVQNYLNRYVDCDEFLNADLIAAGLSPFAPERETPCGVIDFSGTSEQIGTGEEKLRARNDSGSSKLQRSNS